MGSMVGSDLVKAMGAEATATPDQQDVYFDRNSMVRDPNRM